MFSRRRIFALIFGVIAGVLAFHFVPKPLPELSQQELLAEVQAGYVRQVIIIDEEVLTADSSRRGEFRVDLGHVLRHGDKTLIDQLTALGVEVKYETSSPGLI